MVCWETSRTTEHGRSIITHELVRSDSLSFNAADASNASVHTLRTSIGHDGDYIRSMDPVS